MGPVSGDKKRARLGQTNNRTRRNPEGAPEIVKARPITALAKAAAGLAVQGAQAVAARAHSAFTALDGTGAINAGGGLRDLLADARRALFAARDLHADPDNEQKLTKLAVNEFMKSPKLTASLQHVMSSLQAKSKTGGVVDRAWSGLGEALPHLMNREYTRAILTSAQSAGGARGRHLAVAAIRGARQGGVAGGVEHVAEATRKLAASGELPGALGRAAKAAPGVGNALSIAAVADSVRALTHALHAEHEAGEVSRRVLALHLVTSIIGVAIPDVALAGDLAKGAAAKKAKKAAAASEEP